MKFTITILLLSIFFACSSNMDSKNNNSKSAKPNHIGENKIVLDTLSSSFPVQIGNDKGFVKIIGLRTFINQELASSNFSISLNKIQDFSITKQIDKGVLLDSNQSVHLKDTINVDYLDSAIIKNIEFRAVRSNTLYFNVIMENPTYNKEIVGRFSLFYRTKKKGKVYGWFTDEIKEASHNKNKHH